jgi:uncharacterized membrane protein
MDTFKQLKIIFIALASGQIVYFLISLVLIMNELVTTNKDFSTVWGFVVPILVVILVVTSKLLYNYLINSKFEKTSEDEKITSYRTGNIIKFALLEGANLISITFYLLTGDFLYAGMFVIVMGIFFANFPGKEKFMMEFGLSSCENNLNK